MEGAVCTSMPSRTVILGAGVRMEIISRPTPTFRHRAAPQQVNIGKAKEGAPRPSEPAFLLERLLCGTLE